MASTLFSLIAARSPAGACLVQVRLFRSYPYTEEMRQALRDCAASGSVADVARLNVAVGEVFAESALALLADAGVEAGQVRCIGSHGQTLMHLPEPTLIAGRTVRATLQIGEPAVIAARTGITTVADFRPSDMAHGGEGAPLVPLLDAALFGGSGIGGRVLVNIGGIANITVPADGRRLRPACPPVVGGTGVGVCETGSIHSIGLDHRLRHRPRQRPHRRGGASHGARRRHRS